MGCVSSKGGVLVTPALDTSTVFRDNVGSMTVVDPIPEKKVFENTVEGDSGRINVAESVSFRLGNLAKYVEGEQVAAGWPNWLSAVASEAVQGWVPLRVDNFEKLEKIGQGTYSNVFRARDLETGKIVALKKVRFDNFEPESVRFMAREILILRRLDHPNVIKLEGIITSKLSSSIYLVFEYMEHDLAGLVSCPDVKFTESQIKCYMKQLLSGLEHCHSRGVMHRDIKGSNLLVNNEGILKVADFGLANFFSTSHRLPLTSRVVTLWYRPPELLLGSTDYGPSVDLWSVGCVFAEVLLGKPLLQGRTEVEQLHRIFKLCGSPPEEYWKTSKLPHATLFKPQQHYESSLIENCSDLPRTAVDLIEILLSVEPYKRGHASSALCSEYFTTKPFACDPSTLPKYQPNKEIDAKGREDVRRKKTSGRGQGHELGRKTTKKLNGPCKLAPTEVVPLASQAQDHQRVKINGNIAPSNPPEYNKKGREPPKLSVDYKQETSHSKHASQEDVPYSGPLPVPGSSGFAWAKSRRDDANIRSRRRSSSKLSCNGLETYLTSHDRSNSELKKDDDGDISLGERAFSKGHDHYETLKHIVKRQWSQFDLSDSFDASDEYHSQDLSLALYQKEREVNRNQLDQEDKVEFSGPLLSKSYRVDEVLESHERQIRQAVRKSWFPRGRKEGK